MAHEELIATLRWNGENKVWFPADRCSEVADALAAAEASRTAWRETLEAQEDRCAAAEARAEESERDLDEALAKYAAARFDVAAAEAERDRIQGENERLRILVDEYRTEYVDLDFEKRAAEAERDRYRAALVELRDALSWEDAEMRLGFPDRAYGEQVRELGERVGYGVVMSEASRLWYEKAGGGAFAVAGCIALVKRADDRAAAALAEPGSEPATSGSRDG